MNYAQPGAIEKYRNNTVRLGASVSLVPKRCGCGKAVTAKQLAQYRVCAKCWSKK